MAKAKTVIVSPPHFDLPAETARARLFAKLAMQRMDDGHAASYPLSLAYQRLEEANLWLAKAQEMCVACGDEDALQVRFELEPQAGGTA